MEIPLAPSVGWVVDPIPLARWAVSAVGRILRDLSVVWAAGRIPRGLSAASASDAATASGFCASRSIGAISDIPAGD